MLKMYVYDLASMVHVATITGAYNIACEDAFEERFDTDEYGATYSPSFGFNNGLTKNSDAEEIKA